MTKEKLEKKKPRKGVSLIKYFDKAKTTKLVDTKRRSSLRQNQFIENYMSDKIETPNPRRGDLELGLLDSKSRVLTIAPWGRYTLLFQRCFAKSSSLSE